MLATSASLPAEMLRAAQDVSDGRHRGKHQLHIATVGTQLRSMATRTGLGITPDYTLDDAPDADIIFIPSLWRNPKKIIAHNFAVIDWLKVRFTEGTTIAAVGTGCCFIAASGLLDGKPATTHWHYFDRFEKDYPLVNLKRDFFITQAGDIYCAASVNSLADLTVHFIQQLYSLPIAHHIERHFSHEIRRTYESMRYFEGSTDKHSDENILQSQLWFQDHYAEETNIAQVAQKFDMSVRSFNRRFKTATGKTPLQYLQELRMGTARDLLQTTNLSIGEIAYRVGYQDLGHFSQLFKKAYNASPADYRTTVRAKLFSVGT
jgi:transcriptional regulator GlxA family with amidase domain